MAIFRMRKTDEKGGLEVVMTRMVVADEHLEDKDFVESVGDILKRGFRAAAERFVVGELPEPIPFQDRIEAEKMTEAQECIGDAFVLIGELALVKTGGIDCAEDTVGTIEDLQKKAIEIIKRAEDYNVIA